MAAMQTVIEQLAIALGHVPQTVRQWRVRGRVPYRLRLPLLAEAARLGVHLDPQEFDRLSLVGPARPDLRLPRCSTIGGPDVP